MILTRSVQAVGVQAIRVLAIGVLAIGVLAGNLASGILTGSLAVAGDFRVDTEVLVGREKEPIAENLTVFSGGRVYDFLLGDTKEIAIWDPIRGEIHLLDEARQLRTTIAIRELAESLSDLRAKATESDQIAAFDPKFEVQMDEESGWLTMSSKRLTYRVKGSKPQLDGAVQQYLEFADWYARLNAIRNGFPPFARNSVNQEVAQRGWLPEEIERTSTGSLPGQKTVVRSRHITNWSLSKSDRKRVERAGEFLSTFKQVAFAEYQRTSVAAEPE